METKIFRVVPNIYSDNIHKSKAFYIEFLGMDLVMDLTWVLTFASRENHCAQITILKNDKKEPLNNDAIFISIEVNDVDALYEKAKDQHLEIVYDIVDEAWGVRRFFVKDPNGVTVNILAHQD